MDRMPRMKAEGTGQMVSAVIEARPGTAPSLEDIVAHCREHLAGYKTPRRIELVAKMQRTAVGKADYPWARSVLAD